MVQRREAKGRPDGNETGAFPSYARADNRTNPGDGRMSTGRNLGG
jgi:hypothetical protein